MGNYGSTMIPKLELFVLFALDKIFDDVFYGVCNFPNNLEGKLTQQWICMFMEKLMV